MFKHETVILRKHFLTSLKQLTFHNTIFHIQVMEKQKENYQSKLRSITFSDQQNALVKVFLPLIQLSELF